MVVNGNGGGGDEAKCTKVPLSVHLYCVECCIAFRVLKLQSSEHGNHSGDGEENRTTREMTWNNNGAVETSKTLYVQIYGTYIDIACLARLDCGSAV